MGVPRAWKCYTCGLIGPESQFDQPGGHVCPDEACQSEDVFPHRMYRCTTCGKTADQNTWFEEAELDLDPIKLNIPAISCDQCYETLEKRTKPRSNASNDAWRIYQETLKAFKEAPAKLEEVPYAPR